MRAPVSPPAAPSPQARTDLLDAIAFASLLPGIVAAALVAAPTAAIVPFSPMEARARLALLALAGTVFVYGVDRLRDLPRDRDGSPRRSAFVERNRSILLVLYAACGVASLGLASRLPARCLALLGGVLIVGLMHRRFKERAGLKVAYVTLAWVAVTVGLPALALGAPGTYAVASGLTTAIITATVAANLLVSDLRDDAHRVGAFRLPLARALVVFAAAVALLGPAPLRGLALVPICQGLSLAIFTDSERHGLVMVDGSLALGGVAAAIALTLAVTTALG